MGECVQGLSRSLAILVALNILMSRLAPYNISLQASSPVIQYTPSRDGDPATTWNISSVQAVYFPHGGGATVTRPSDTTMFVRTQSSGAVISIPFVGSAIYLCFASGGTDYTLTVDGTRFQKTEADASVQPVCAAYAAAKVDTLLFADGLDPSSEHNAVLEVSADPTHEFRFFGATVTISVTTDGRTVDDSTIADDRNTTWYMAPDFGGALNWNQNVGHPSAYDGTMSFTCSYNPQGYANASYTFSGAGGVVLYGTVWSAIRAFSVIFDGITTKIDALNGGATIQVVLFYAGALDPGVEHTLTLSDYNSDFPTCPAALCCMSLDAIAILKPGANVLPSPVTTSSAPLDQATTSPPPNPPDGTHFNVTAVAVGCAGGALFVMAALAIIVVLFRRFWRTPTYDLTQRDMASASEISPLPPPPLHSAAFWGGAESYQPTSPSQKVSSKEQTDVRVGHGADANRDSPLAKEDLERVAQLVMQRVDVPDSRTARRYDSENPPLYIAPPPAR